MFPLPPVAAPIPDAVLTFPINPLTAWFVLALALAGACALLALVSLCQSTAPTETVETVPTPP